MAKQKKTIGEISLAEQELVSIKEEIQNNTTAYQALWQKRINALEVGNVLEAHNLEHQYYYKQGTVPYELDRRRIEAVDRLEGMLGYKFRLEEKLPREKRNLKREQMELESVKYEAERMIKQQEEKIANAEMVVANTKEQLMELSGE